MSRKKVFRKYVEAPDISLMPLTQVVSELQKLLLSIPEEYRDGAMFEVDADTEYDCPYAEFNCYYSYEETDEQFELRMEKKAKVDRERAEQAKGLRRLLFETLKEEFK